MDNIMISPIRHLDLRSKPDGAYFVRLLFIVGTIMGCAFGLYFYNKPSFALENSVTFETYWGAMLYTFKFAAAVLAFGTSFLGIFLIPALSLVYAFSLAASVAASYSSSGSIANMIFCYAIPSLICLPCFFSLADTMLVSSKRLCYFSFQDMIVGGHPTARREILVISALLFLISLYYYFALPEIINLTAR